MIEASSLDIGAVGAFVLVADLKSFTRTAEVLGTTQSAVSLKIKRLEDRLGRRLLERTPRAVKLSADGAAFLEGARSLVDAHRDALDSFGQETRRLRLGLSDHLVGPDLPLLLKAIARSHPALTIGLEIAPSCVLLRAFETGSIDAAIVLRDDAGRREGIAIGGEPFFWAAAPDFSAGTPLRVATHSEICGVRRLALRALDNAGITWTEAFSGGGIGAVAAAVSAGLAVAAMARRTAPPGCIDVTNPLGLPRLPRPDIVLHTGTTDARTKAALRTIGTAFKGS